LIAGLPLGLTSTLTDEMGDYTECHASTPASPIRWMRRISPSAMKSAARRTVFDGYLNADDTLTMTWRHNAQKPE